MAEIAAVGLDQRLMRIERRVNVAEIDGIVRTLRRLPEISGFTSAMVAPSKKLVFCFGEG